MNSGINLLQTKGKDADVNSKVLLGYRIVSVVLLCIVLLSGVTFLVMKLQSPLPKLKGEERNLRRNLTAFARRQTKVDIIQNRLLYINNIIKSRTKYDEIIDIIDTEIPSGAALESLEIDKKTVYVTVASSSLSDINSAYEKIISLAGRDIRFKRLFLNDLSIDTKSGEYLLTLKADTI